MGSQDISSNASVCLGKTMSKNVYLWFGPHPRVTIMDPELIRDVMIRFNDFQKPNDNPLVKLLATGVANSNGEQWAKPRKIITPAFHKEKLKVTPCVLTIFISFSFSFFFFCLFCYVHLKNLEKGCIW